MKKLIISLMLIALFLLSLVLTHTNAYAIDANFYKPAVYYPYLWKLGGPNLHDNPNSIQLPSLCLHFLSRGILYNLFSELEFNIYSGNPIFLRYNRKQFCMNI